MAVLAERNPRPTWLCAHCEATLFGPVAFCPYCGDATTSAGVRTRLADRVANDGTPPAFAFPTPPIASAAPMPVAAAPGPVGAGRRIAGLGLLVVVLGAGIAHLVPPKMAARQLAPVAPTPIAAPAAAPTIEPVPESVTAPAPVPQASPPASEASTLGAAQALGLDIAPAKPAPPPASAPLSVPAAAACNDAMAALALCASPATPP